MLQSFDICLLNDKKLFTIENMLKIQLVANKSGRLLKILNFENPEVSYSVFSAALRKKDIIVNGKRQCLDIKIEAGDEIIAYVPEQAKKQLFEIFYQDENIVVVNKAKGIEVCDGENNIENILSKTNVFIKAVHRIDLNTSGLVMFAKNQNAYTELCNNFSKGNIKKFYLTKVFGNPKQQDNLVAYLKKDAQKGFVKIYDDKVDGAEKIQTKYVLKQREQNTSILEVELFCGKTHQIRAHLAHVGLPIVGDGKYGNNSQNKMAKKSKQCLTAYKLVFDLPGISFLSYLNKKQFVLQNINL